MAGVAMFSLSSKVLRSFAILFVGCHVTVRVGLMDLVLTVAKRRTVRKMMRMDLKTMIRF
jgi:hypothetical protein